LTDLKDHQRAVAWCAEHAAGLGAGVIAIHAVEVPMSTWRLDVDVPPIYTDEERERIIETVLQGDDLGRTSHHLSHHLNRPLLIIP